MQENVLTKEAAARGSVAQTVRPDGDAGASIIVTVKNQAEDLKEVYGALKSGLEAAAENYELIFVDDGSVDNTWSLLKEFADDDPRLRLIRMRTSFGESAAFDAGFKQARGEKIVFFTTRVRINAAQIASLLGRLDANHDLIMGWRHPRRDSALNQFVSRCFNTIIRWVSKKTFNDINSGVFAAKREVLTDIPLYGNLNIFLPILADRKGFKVGDEKIEQLHGTFRQSKYFTEYIQRLLDIITVFFLTNYSKKPLHFLGFIGGIFTLLGVGMNAYLFFYRIFQFGPIAGRPLLLLGALMLVIGIQMISIGLIGEMIIFTHAKDIKEYVIEEVLE